MCYKLLHIAVLLHSSVLNEFLIVFFISLIRENRAMRDFPNTADPVKHTYFKSNSLPTNQKSKNDS